MTERCNPSEWFGMWLKRQAILKKMRMKPTAAAFSAASRELLKISTAWQTTMAASRKNSNSVTHATSEFLFRINLATSLTRRGIPKAAETMALAELLVRTDSGVVSI
jgi:hypothetical protein